MVCGSVWSLVFMVTVFWFHGGECLDCPTARFWYKCTTSLGEELCYTVTDSQVAHDNGKCRALHPQADLALLDSARTCEACVINNYLDIGIPSAFPGVWIGLTMTSSVYTWVDGEVMDYRLNNNPPYQQVTTDGCVSLLDNYPSYGLWRWQKLDCTTQTYALCSLNLSALTQTTVPPTTVPDTTTVQLTTVPDTTTVQPTTVAATTTVQPTTTVLDTTTLEDTTLHTTILDTTTIIETTTVSDTTTQSLTSTILPTTVQSTTTLTTVEQITTNSGSTTERTTVSSITHQATAAVSYITVIETSKMEDKATVTSGPDSTSFSTIPESSTSVSKATHCSRPGCPVNTHCHFSHFTLGEIAVGQSAEYSCQIGLQFPSGAVTHSLECTETGELSGSPPQCQDIQCPESSNVIGLEASVYGVTLEISCPDGGYFISGVTRYNTSCTIEGVWSHVTEGVYCLEGVTSCPEIPYVDNTDTYYTDTLVNSTVTFACHRGHRFPTGLTERNLTCQEEGTWSHEYLPGCLVITCPPVPSVANAVASTDLAIYGTEVNITCLYGYQYADLSLGKNTTCLETGNWSSYLGDCQRIECSTEPTMLSSVSMDTGYYTDDVRMYTCDPDTLRFWDGYRRMNITCLHTGEWDVTYVDCTDNRCPPVFVISNAVPSTINASAGIQVAYECDTGHYFPDGSTTQTTECVSGTKEWEPVISDGCMPIQCGPPSTPHNATVTYTSTIFSASANHTCVVGHVWSDNHGNQLLPSDTIVTSYCMKNGSWSSNVSDMECTPIDCGPPLEVSHSMSTVANATATSIDCGSPPEVSHSTLTVANATTTYGSMVTYACQANYWIMRSVFSADVTCQTDGAWAVIPQCTEVSCAPVPTWESAVFSSLATSPGTELNYTCHDGYSVNTGSGGLVTSQATLCLSSGEWQPDILSCQETLHVPTVYPLFEAPRSTSIGTVSTVTILIVFLTIIAMDIMTHGKRFAIPNVPMLRGFGRSNHRQLSDKRKDRDSPWEHSPDTAQYSTYSDLSPRDLSPRDLSPLLIEEIADNEINKMLAERLENIHHKVELLHSGHIHVQAGNDTGNGDSFDSVSQPMVNDTMLPRKQRRASYYDITLMNTTDQNKLIDNMKSEEEHLAELFQTSSFPNDEEAYRRISSSKQSVSSIKMEFLSEKSPEDIGMNAKKKKSKIKNILKKKRKTKLVEFKPIV